MEFVSMSLEKSMGSIPIGFLPSQVSGLKLWTRFNRGITEAGSGISQWDDASGNGNHLKQGTDANRPTKESDGSVLCDGIAQFLKADAFTFVQPEVIYILCRQVTWVSGHYIFDGNTLNDGALFQRTTTPNLALYAGASAVADNTDLTVNIYNVIRVVFNGASSSLKIGNEAATTGDPGTVNMGGLTLGAKGDGAGHANAQFKEVIALDAVPDAATDAQMIKYLADVGDLSI